MALELTVTAKGQVTLRRAVLNHLGVTPGAKVGTICNNPQPGHSRSCGSLIGWSAAERITGR